MDSVLKFTVFVLALATCLQICHASCDPRSIRNFTNGSLEICERNSNNDLAWFHVCTAPTPALISSLLCRETDCRMFCNRFNYTVLHLDTNIRGYEFDCEPSDERSRQCDREIFWCDSIIDTLNCECDVNCSNQYVNPGFCSANECSCRPGFDGPECTASTTPASTNILNIQPTQTSAISTSAMEPPVMNTHTISPTPTNQAFSNVTMAVRNTPASILWISVSACFFGIILICIALLVCVIILVFYIRARPSKLKALERRILFTNQVNTPSQEPELVNRANTCSDIDDVMYASVNYNGMMEQSNPDPDYRYNGVDKARRSTSAAPYIVVSSNLAGIPEVSTNTKGFDENVFARSHCDTRLGNVENLIYTSVPDQNISSKTDLYLTYESLGNEPHEFSSSIVLSQQMRVGDIQPAYLQVGKRYFSQQNFFVEPPSDEEAIYDNMCENNFREIDRGCISLQKNIGSGCFGEVKLGQWRVDRDTEPIPVAVKLLRRNADDELRISFLKEAAIMGQFHHPNVLQLLGIVSITQPIMLVIELMETDLRTILESLDGMKFDSDRLATSLLRSTREIVSGMDYLSSKHYIHRDLAARNVLVGKDNVCRISDFGMSKRMHENKDYYKVERGGLLPVRWTAPEAIFFRRYSEKSDVWSLGMTLFEVWSLGRKPWSGYSNEEVLGMISSDQIQGPPTGCPREIYSIMVSTWRADAEQRPTFRELSKSLNRREEELLRIPEELRSIDLACQLGNDPSLTAELYSELRS